MTASHSLIASYWTIAGDAVPLRAGKSEISPYPLPDRIAAAAKAGFTGIGFSFEDLNASIARYGLDEIASRLRDNGIIDVEVEMLSDWFAEGEARAASDRVRSVLLDAALALGARHLKCGGPGANATVASDHLAHEFGALCDDAARIGINVAIEPMPFTSLATPAAALELVENAGRENGGLCIDVWHVARSGTDYDSIARIPGRFIKAVELNDADAEPVGALLDDTLDRRKPCGQGDLRVTDFVAAIRKTGYDGPYGIEIISEQHRALPLDEAARLAFDTAVETLDAVAVGAEA